MAKGPSPELPAEALLLPRPVRVERTSAEFPLDALRSQYKGATLPVQAPVGNEALQRLLPHLETFAQELLGAAQIRLQTSVAPIRIGFAPQLAARSADAYTLAVENERVTLTAGGAAGLYYALQTLRQWLRLNGALPGVGVFDEPAFRNRGYMLDISRNRVPRMQSLRELVPWLGHLKLNQLQLYTEHTFAYSGHEEVWREWSPMTAEEIEELDRLCKQHFIELVPNQNSFGHMHRWLVHDRYRPLAECPDGIEHPFSRDIEPFSLCATDETSFSFLDGLYEQLLPHFSSKQINVGLDETFDLGQGKSAKQCFARGKETVYLDFVNRVHEMIKNRGARMQMWADILLEEDAPLERVPNDAVLLNWGYEANHPFEKETRKLQAAENEYYVCPGTSSWNSFGGRLQNALENLASAGLWGRKHEAAGYLITDWGDFGHLQPPVVSLPGLLTGAAHGWQPMDGSPPIQEWLYRHSPSEYQEQAAALDALLELAQLYRVTGAPWRNGSALFWLVVLPDQSLEAPRLRGLNRPSLLDICERIGATRETLSSDALVERELRFVADALELGARVGAARLDAGRGTSLAGASGAAKRELDRRVSHLLAELDPIWLERSRPGGLSDSQQRLSDLKSALDV